MSDMESVLPALRQGMGEVDFVVLQQFIEKQPVAKGAAVIRAGERMDFSFFIISGHFSVHLGNESAELGNCGCGGWFGHLSFLEPEESALAVIASSDAMIGRLNHSAFEKLFAEHPATADKLLRILSLELSNGMRKAGKSLFRRFAWDQVEGDAGEEAAMNWLTKVYCELNAVAV